MIESVEFRQGGLSAGKCKNGTLADFSGYKRVHEGGNEVLPAHAKYDKTSSSKDVLIKAKDKRITKREEENKRLKAELMHLRGLLYESK